MRCIRVSLVICVVLVFVATPARADEPARVAPPFTTARSYSGECLERTGAAVLLDRCKAEAVSDIDGSIRHSLLLESPGAGARPGAGWVYASSTLRGFAFPPAADKVVFTVSARAASSGGVSGTTLPPWVSSAHMGITMVVENLACESGCYGYDSANLIDVRKGHFVNGAFTLAAALRSDDGGSMPAAPVRISIEVYGDANLGTQFYAPIPDTGRVSADLDMQVLGVSFVTHDASDEEQVDP